MVPNAPNLRLSGTGKTRKQGSFNQVIPGEKQSDIHSVCETWKQHRLFLKSQERLQVRKELLEFKKTKEAPSVMNA